MKVLQLISSSGYYGAEAVVVSLSQGLQQIGISSILGVFRNANKPSLELAEIAQTKGIPVELIACNGRADRQTWLAIREIIRRERIDLLNSHGYKAHLYAHFAARATTCCTIATCHGHHTRNSNKGVLNVSRVKVWGYKKIERAVLPRFDRVIAVSDQIASSLQTAGVRAKKLAVITNGIDVPEFESAGPANDLENLKQGGLAIGLVSRLVYGKGHEQLLEIAGNLLVQCPNTSFFIVGDGPRLEMLQTLAHELRIARSVFFLGKRRDMPQVYASLDLLVLPSIAEGTPMAILEALAAKKAVIASNVGGIPAIILDHKTGRLVEPGDSIAFQEAAIRLLKDADLRSRLGAAGNALVKERYSASHMAHKYAAEYRKLTSSEYAASATA